MRARPLGHVDGRLQRAAEGVAGPFRSRRRPALGLVAGGADVGEVAGQTIELFGAGLKPAQRDVCSTGHDGPSAAVRSQHRPPLPGQLQPQPHFPFGDALGRRDVA